MEFPAVLGVFLNNAMMKLGGGQPACGAGTGTATGAKATALPTGCGAARATAGAASTDLAAFMLRFCVATTLIQVDGQEWGPPQASQKKASEPHFLRFGVCIFCVFRVFALCNLLRPFFLFFGGRERTSAFSSFSLYWVRIADLENRTTGFRMTGLR